MNYNALAGKYDRVIRKNFRDYESILEVIADVLNNHKRILDFGAGTGDLTVKICQKNKKAKVTAIDESQKMLQIAREKIKRNNFKNRVKLIRADSIHGTKRYDAITSTFTIYLLDRKQIISDFSKSLERGGLLVLTDICVKTSWERLNANFLRAAQVLSFLPVANFWAPEKMNKLLEKNGFHKINLIKASRFWGLPVYLITAIKR